MNPTGYEGSTHIFVSPNGPKLSIALALPARLRVRRSTDSKWERTVIINVYKSGTSGRRVRQQQDLEVKERDKSAGVPAFGQLSSRGFQFYTSACPSYWSTYVIHDTTQQAHHTAGVYIRRAYGTWREPMDACRDDNLSRESFALTSET